MKTTILFGVLAGTLVSAAIADSTLAPVPVADSGLVSVFPNQTVKVNLVNLDPDPSHGCSYNVALINMDGDSIPLDPAVPSIPGSGGSVSSAFSGFLAPDQVRAHIDFSQQILDNASAPDPMLGCYRLAPTLEVVDGTGQRLLSSVFFGLPAAGKGIAPLKITICHKAGPHGKTNSQVVAAASWNAHHNHGDTLGPCLN